MAFEQAFSPMGVQYYHSSGIRFADLGRTTLLHGHIDVPFGDFLQLELEA